MSKTNWADSRPHRMHVNGLQHDGQAVMTGRPEGTPHVRPPAGDSPCATILQVNGHVKRTGESEP